MGRSCLFKNKNNIYKILVLLMETGERNRGFGS
jgi:hypothetical protein